MNLITAILLLLLAVPEPRIEATKAVVITPTPTAIVKSVSVVSVDNIVSLTNVEREKKGLGKLTEDSRLDKSATTKACDLVKRNYWDHVDPDGKHSWHLFIENGYRYTYAGENLARNYDSDTEAITAWMNSKTHRDNILNKNYKDIGVGRCGNYIVQHFGRL